MLLQHCTKCLCALSHLVLKTVPTVGTRIVLTLRWANLGTKEGDSYTIIENIRTRYKPSVYTRVVLSVPDLMPSALGKNTFVK